MKKIFTVIFCCIIVMSFVMTASAAADVMFTDTGAWKGGVKIQDGVVTLDTFLSATYPEEGMYNQMLSFKLKTDVSDASKWSGFAIRQTTSGDVPVWAEAGSCYIVVFKKDIIELQKFYKGAQIFFKTDKNTVFTDSTKFYDIEFGAINEGDSVRLILKVDGKEIYNYLDTTDVVKEAGTFALYGYTNPISIQAAPVTTQPVTSPATGDAGVLIFVLTLSASAVAGLIAKKKLK